MQERCGSSVFALELHLFCMKPSIWPLTVIRGQTLNWVMNCWYSMSILFLVLTHWGQEEIALFADDIFKCISPVRLYEFRLIFYWRFFSQQSNWQKVSLGAGNGLTSTLNPRWLNLLMHICFTRPQRVYHPWWFHPFDNCCIVKLWMDDHFVYVVHHCLQETIKHLFDHWCPWIAIQFCG